MYFSKQEIIKLILKKDKNKWFIKYCRPVFLLNFDTKLVSKVLAECLKTALPTLIFLNQTAYLRDSLIVEGGRLISGIFEVSDLLKLKWLLLSVDIEQPFDFINENFLLKVQGNYGFSHDFLKRICISL